MEKYTKGKWYKGLGRYIGIMKVHPYKESYYKRVHRFIISTSDDGRGSDEINEIEIDRVEK